MKFLQQIKGLLQREKNNLVLENPDWRELNVFPQEAVTKEELDNLQNEVVEEINRMQDDFANKTSSESFTFSAKPQSLYYFHKYIDAKFDKKNFDFDRFFFAKQNLVDRKYAEGMGELHSEIADYRDLMVSVNELGRRLQRKINQLDPDAKMRVDDLLIQEHADFHTQLEKLPAKINWQEIEERLAK